MGLSTSTKTFAERLEESKKDQFAKAAVAKAQDPNGTRENQHVMN